MKFDYQITANDAGVHLTHRREGAEAYSMVQACMPDLRAAAEVMLEHHAAAAAAARSES